MEYDNSWEAILKPGEAEDFFDTSHVPAGCIPPFSVDASGYDPVNAWWLAEMSRLIYRRGEDEVGDSANPVTRNDYLRQVGLEETLFINEGNTPCAIFSSLPGYGEPFSVLVFRGTKGFDTWLSNLNTLQVSWPTGGSVHCGFKQGFYNLWPSLSGALADIRHPVFYTGHSLGGALAALAAACHPPRAVYTFGAPRVGDAVFAQSQSMLRVYRIANCLDIVPSVPPSRIPFDFHHVGELTLLGKNGNGNDLKQMERDEAPEHRFALKMGIESAIRQTRSRLLRPPEFLSHHAPINYSLGILMKWAEEAHLTP